MRKFFIIIILFFPLKSFAGDIDGKGLVCGSVGYFFDNGNHALHYVRNGELKKSNKGPYSTTPKRINVESMVGKSRVIYRNNPKVLDYDCKIAIGYPLFMEMLNTNLENIKKNNKI